MLIVADSHLDEEEVHGGGRFLLGPPLAVHRRWRCGDRSEGEAGVGKRAREGSSIEEAAAQRQPVVVIGVSYTLEINGARRRSVGNDRRAKTRTGSKHLPPLGSRPPGLYCLGDATHVGLWDSDGTVLRISESSGGNWVILSPT